MSEWGDILTVIEAEVRAAIPTMPAGELGFRRTLEVGQDLRNEQLPHCFAHNPTEAATEAAVGQRLVRFGIQLDIWVRNETQEQLATKLDAVVTELRGNPTLGGEVEKLIISLRGIREFSGKAERVGVLLVETEKYI